VSFALPAPPCYPPRMKPDIYTKAVLTVIAAFLAVTALRPIVRPEPVHAAQYKYEIKAWQNFKIPVDTHGVATQSLNEEAQNGWELVAAIPITTTVPNNYIYTQEVMFIFKKQ